MLGRASPPFCPAVERVLLNGCGRLTDRGLQTLSRRCPELRHVEMRGCTQVTDVGVLELVSKCVHLSHLDVSGNWPTFYLQNSSAPHNFPNSKFKKKTMRIPPSPLPAQIKKKTSIAESIADHRWRWWELHRWETSRNNQKFIFAETNTAIFSIQKSKKRSTKYWW